MSVQRKMHRTSAVQCIVQIRVLFDISADKTRKREIKFGGKTNWLSATTH